MNRIYHIVKVAPAILLAAMSASSCIYDYEDYPEGATETILVNTMSVDGGYVMPTATTGDNTSMVLFWNTVEHLENPSGADAWPSPYHEGHAPQPVDFYERSVFDTRYPYPDETAPLYATGYAPGTVLRPAGGSGNNKDYSKLTANAGNMDKGRYDFLGCDVWSDVYKGSLNDPFSHDKNRLYFRHLAAKLVFYAYRDENTMENKQFVRNVEITNLHMSIDGGAHWTPMFTPDAFEWKALDYPDDFTDSYDKAIEKVKGVEGNEAVTSRPKAGYKAVRAQSFAGDDPSFVLQKNATDRVPVYGMAIDSCFVCSPFDNDGNVIPAGSPIKLKMDISAEMSFHPDFPMTDEGGSTTDDLTFTRRTWKGITLEAIRQVGKEGSDIIEFKPGREYRVYIHFHRTGVNTTAIELPWNIGGVHYITIPGGDRNNAAEKNQSN